jgi:hypothetical protein
VTAGGVPSNLATIPVASSGRICSDAELIPMTTGEYQTLLSQSNVNAGLISLTKLTTATPPAGTSSSDLASAEFRKITTQQFASADFLQQASVGSCLVTYDYLQTPNAGVDPGVTPPGVFRGFGLLDAGQQIDVSGPDGSLALPEYGLGSYPEPAGISPVIIPSTGGSFTFDNGSGGADIGAFAVTSNDTLTTPLVWTNSAAITSINREKGQSVTWTGGAPGTYVNIFGYSYYTEVGAFAFPTIVSVYFTCTAAVSAGQFTVPAAVLGNLPLPGGFLGGVGGPASSGNGHLYVVNQTIQRFSAPGLDLGLISFGVGSGISVLFN